MSDTDLCANCENADAEGLYLLDDVDMGLCLECAEDTNAEEYDCD